ncbi:hypothetical protein [uncultured Paraglaciecola sp.]|jgi:hypothetical protein|uniref:hypothetical protein n=1 Tax=uncultured Paraglaciecola sp. TaxID=1765024 RepID=UPI0025D6FA50|nr:hypothetical protein [uncultured Paraglaciecola sp.]
MSRWIVLPILALAAIGFYSIGNVSSLVVFLIIGFMFELAFWFKAFPKKRNKP